MLLDIHWNDACHRILSQPCDAVMLSIHSSFAHAVNLMFSDEDKLYTLLSCGSALVPYGLVSPCPDFHVITAKDRCRLTYEYSSGLLYFEFMRIADDQVLKSFCIDMKSIKVKSCRCRCRFQSEAECRHARTHTYNSLIKFSQLRPRLGSFVLQEGLGFNHAYIHERIVQLGACFYSPKNERRKRINTIIEGLVGAGIGLTPSGDDVMCGYLAVLSCFPELYDFRQEISLALSHCLFRTTDISRQMLQAAIQHEFSATMLNYLEALQQYDDDTACCMLDSAAQNLCSVGSSSGSDMLFGVWLGLGFAQQQFRRGSVS